MYKILCADDDLNLLEGVKRVLHSKRQEWALTVAPGGQRALEILEADPEFDLVISDLQMPGLDGIQLLREVRERYPNLLRFLLSGATEGRTLFDGVGVAHRFLPKPCGAGQLIASVQASLALRQRLRGEIVRSAFLKMGAMPALPALYQEVAGEMELPEPSIARISSIIEQDIGMSSKLLQVANSAAFGLRCKVSSVAQVIRIMGLDRIKMALLMSGLFAPIKAEDVPAEFDLEGLWRHSLLVAKLAKAIALAEEAAEPLVEDCFTGGLLHDLGQLVLASRLGGEFQAALLLAREEGVPLVLAEERLLGITHAQVGGALLELWELPHGVVEAVTYLHTPAEFAERALTPLAVVCAANFLSKDASSSGGAEGEMGPFLQALGLEHRLSAWRKILASFACQSGKSAVGFPPA